jgi:undecaprenyl-diphosphatase
VEFVVLVALLVIVAGTWAFAELAGEVLEGQTQKIDEAIVRAMRRPDNPAVPIGPDWLAESARDVTALGGMAVLLLVTAGVAGFLLLSRKAATMWFVVGATTGGAALSLALKAAFDRPRPDVVPHLAYVYTSSFPSGHSMMSAVVYLTLGALLARSVARKRLKLYLLAIAVLLTAMIGITRVYLGVHYPTDVLAGWSAGLVWATLCWLLARLLQRKGTIEEEGD